MKLADYLSSQNLNAAEFGRLIGVSRSAALLYVQGKRIPRPGVMASISRETGGQVTAQDFYGAQEDGAAGDDAGEAAA